MLDGNISLFPCGERKENAVFFNDISSVPTETDIIVKKPLLSVNKRGFLRGAEDRGRTGTGITTHGILSPGRLPIPPLRQALLTKLLYIK